MHNLSIKKNDNIAFVFEINLSQERHCKILLTLVCMGQTLLVCGVHTLMQSSCSLSKPRQENVGKYVNKKIMCN